MKSQFLLILAAAPLLAHGVGLQFQVLANPAGMVRIMDLNHRGDIAGNTGFNYRAIINGVVNDLPYTVPTSGGAVAEVRVAENGWVYGRRGNVGQFNLFTPVIRRPGENWTEYTGFTQAEAIGVTSAGKVLVRQGFNLTRPYWWDSTSNSVTLIPGEEGRSVACNLAGDVIVQLYPGRLLRNGGSAINLNYGGLQNFAEGMNEAGDVAGGAGDNGGSGLSAGIGLIWDRNGNVVRAIPLDSPGGGYTYFEDINNSRVAVGSRSIPTSDGKAVYWSDATGAIDIDSNLTATSAGWHIQSAERISDNGLILASGYRSGSSTYESVLIQVVPEPVTFAPVALGFGVLLRRKKRP